jgi:hypothetical protein
MPERSRAGGARSIVGRSVGVLFLSGCGDGPVTPDTATTLPVPAIASLTPSFVLAGGGGVDITITGTGFVPQSPFLHAPPVLYGYTNAHTGFEFFAIKIDDAGATHQSVTSGLGGGSYTDILGAAARVYGTDGSVVDAERRVRLGEFPVGGLATSMAIDPVTGRAFALTGGLTGEGIAVFDLNTFGRLGTITTPEIILAHPANVVARLVRWGTDGLALFELDEVILVRSAIIAP